MNLIEKALIFATQAHVGQVRKYTKEPYIYHPIEVSRIVWEVNQDPEIIVSACLHDTCEDCNISLETIEKEFGKRVRDLVSDLTDVSKPEDGNRARRKEIDRLHTAAAHPDAKLIKIADLISNTNSIVAEDPDFARTYIAEKKLLLPHLVGINDVLWARAYKQVVEYDQALLDGWFSKRGLRL